MSKPNNKRNWLIDWFFSSTNVRNDGLLIPRTAESFFKDPVNSTSITSDILQESAQEKSFLYPVKASTAPRFVPLQRLDSVGGTEPERFSYPPTKLPCTQRTEDFNNFVGNQLQPNWFPKHFLSHQNPSDTTFHLKENISSCISKVGSYLLSSLQEFSGRFTSGFASLPEMDTVGLLQASTSVSETKEALTMPLLKEPVLAGAAATSKMMTCKTQLSLFCNDAVSASKMNLTPAIHSAFESTESNAGLHPAKKYVYNCKNVGNTIATCFERAPNCEPLHENVPEQTCINAVAQQVCNMPNCGTENTMAINLLQTDEAPPCLEKQNNKNGLLSSTVTCTHIAPVETDCDSDDSSVTSCCPENCVDDCCSDVASIYSDEDYDYFSDDSSVCENESDDENDVENDITDDEICPWERIVSPRVPWTCSQPRKTKVQPQCTSFSSDTPEKSSITKVKISNSKQLQTAEHVSVDDYHFSSLTCDGGKPNTVIKRPECSNSDISFILGWSNGESESDEEDNCSLFSDQDSFTSPETCLDMHPKDGTSNDSNKQLCETSSMCETPKSDDACALWDYFVKCQGPFLHVTSKESSCVIKSSSCPSLINLCQCVESNAPVENVSPPENDETEESSFSYKAPTKVRFSDEVTVHPMIAWSFAYREARKGCWDREARDRDRFKTRIQKVEKEISWCFAPNHRVKIQEAIKCLPFDC